MRGHAMCTVGAFVLMAFLAIEASSQDRGPASGRPPRFDRGLEEFVAVIKAAWLSPLGLAGITLDLNTEMTDSSEELDIVYFSVLRNGGSCDSLDGRLILKGKLGLNFGFDLSCWEYNEPSGAKVARGVVDRRIATVQDWLRKSLQLEVQPAGAVSGERGFTVSGAQYSGEAWFDETTGVLRSLLLLPREGVIQMRERTSETDKVHQD